MERLNEAAPGVVAVAVVVMGELGGKGEEAGACGAAAAASGV